MTENRRWMLRDGMEADAAAVLDLWTRAGGRRSATDDEPSLMVLMKSDPDALLLPVADQRLIGSLIVGWDGWRGSFYRLAVDPGWRRQGIARELVRLGEERLLARGAKRLTAIVAADDSTARSFWLSAGYRNQEDMTRFVRMPSTSPE